MIMQVSTLNKAEYKLKLALENFRNLLTDEMLIFIHRKSIFYRDESQKRKIDNSEYPLRETGWKTGTNFPEKHRIFPYSKKFHDMHLINTSIHHEFEQANNFRHVICGQISKLNGTQRITLI